MRTLGGNVPIGSNVRSPRFRRDPFVRDVVFDHGRASAPRITGPHMLPSTLLTVSASAISWFSRLNSTPHTITVYASQPPSPATTQHSLPGARYGLPGPDFHRQDHASSCLAHKQSISPRKERMDCFASLAMTAKHTFATSPRHAPEALLYLPPKEGVGNAGCPLHPRPRVHLVVVERTRVTTSTPESPDVPARNGFNGFLRALVGDRALLPPSPADMFLSKPGWADSNSANLTPASGRQDHTTSPYAATSFVRSPFDRSQAFRQPALPSRRAPNAAASTASLPASVTIMIRPW